MRGFGRSWVGRINTTQIALVPAFLAGFVLALLVGLRPISSDVPRHSSAAPKTQALLPIENIKNINLAKPEPVLPEPPEPLDCHKTSCIALTFDDGPNPATTPQILDELSKAKVPASFFVLGWRVAGNESILKRMHDEGHEIGNHSWDHPDLTLLSTEDVKQQVDSTQKAIVSAGLPAPTLFRPPYGAFNQAILNNVPMNLMLWNADPHDWSADTPEQVVQTAEASAKPGTVLDMHDIYHVTANALPKIITDLQAKDYHFVTVSELLDIKPGEHGVFYGHP